MTGVDDAAAAQQQQQPAPSSPQELMIVDDEEKEEEEKKTESPSEEATTTTTVEAATATAASDQKKDDAAVANNKKAKEKKDDEDDGKDYSDWPYKSIKEPHDNDVLYGRGGGTNHHPGNKRYRKMVEDKKIEYVNCKRLDKPLVALSIIKIWRTQKPPGRFLKMDDKSGLWNDVGDKKAREKTSQALREKAPEIRKELERERRIENGEEVSEEEEEVVEGPRPGIVARDHSLGRDYVSNNEGVSLGNFHWTEGVQREGSDTFLPPPQMPLYQQQPYPGSRTSSNTSFVRPEVPSPGVFPEHMTSMDHVHLMFAEQHNQQMQQQRYESAGSVPSVPGYVNYPPVHTTSGGSVPSLPGGYYPPLHATSNGSIPPSPPPGPPAYSNSSNGYPAMIHTTSTSWTGAAAAREHSLSQNQLPHATCNQAAYPTAFDATRTASGQWRPPPMPMTYHYTPPGGHTPYQQQHHVVAPPPPHTSPGNNSVIYVQQPQHQHQQAQHQPVPPQQHQQQIGYAVDPAVASQWSSQSYPGVPAFPPQQQHQQQPSTSQSSQSVPPPELTRDHYLPNPYLQHQQQQATNAPKPEIVKRATSHQNETAENRHGFDGQSVKRAFMSRDGSVASSRMKQEYQQQPASSSSSTEYGAAAPPPPARPSALTLEERMSTLDLDAAASSSAAAAANTTATQRPRTLTASNRLSTIDALTLDFDNPDRGLEDLFDNPSENEQQQQQQQYRFQQQPKPSALLTSMRVTTMDLIDIVNEPLPFTEV